MNDQDFFSTVQMLHNFDFLFSQLAVLYDHFANKPYMEDALILRIESSLIRGRSWRVSGAFANRATSKIEIPEKTAVNNRSLLHGFRKYVGFC